MQPSQRRDIRTGLYHVMTPGPDVPEQHPTVMVQRPGTKNDSTVPGYILITR